MVKRTEPLYWIERPIFPVRLWQSPGKGTKPQSHCRRQARTKPCQQDKSSELLHFPKLFGKLYLPSFLLPPFRVCFPAPFKPPHFLQSLSPTVEMLIHCISDLHVGLSLCFSLFLSPPPELLRFIALQTYSRAGGVLSRL